MRSVSTRFFIPFGLLALFISFVVFFRAYEASRKNARELVSQQVALALEFNLAIREYAADTIRPISQNLAGNGVFIPEVMSTSLISRNIFEAVRKKFPQYIIRFSAENPRNPLNTAGPDELRMIEFFQGNHDLDEVTEKILIDGKPYLAHFAAKWMKPECMQCHDDPKDAPAELIKRYGSTASFRRKVGDVVGLDMVAVPLDATEAPLAAEMRSQFLHLVLGLLFLFGSVFFVFRFVVAGRLTAMATHFNEIAGHAESSQMIPLEIKGNDEISDLGVAFNKLLGHLRGSYALLEQRVGRRTEELRAANEQLQMELAERKRAEEALKESRQLMADIVSFLPDPTFVIDRQGKVISWNKAMEEMSGIAASDILGKGDYEYALPFHGERRPVLIDLIFEPQAEVGATYTTLERKGSVLYRGGSHTFPRGQGSIPVRDGRGIARFHGGRGWRDRIHAGHHGEQKTPAGKRKTAGSVEARPQDGGGRHSGGRHCT